MPAPRGPRTEKIAVLSAGPTWHVQDLMRASALLGVEVEPIDFRTLAAWIEKGGGARRPAVSGGGLDLARAGAVLVRSMPAGSLEQVVFRMDALHALAAHGVPVVNPPRALETAIDKYLALCRLEAAGLPVPRTAACERPEDLDGAFDALGGDVVVKPLFGSEGRGIVRCRGAAELRRSLQAAAAEGRVLYVQEFLDHGGEDLRVFVIGGEVAAAMRRSAPPGEWITNIARGGRGTAVDLEGTARDLALRASAAVGAEVAGVDIVEDRRRGACVLEVNAVPGWRALAATSGKDIALEVLRYVASCA